MVQGQPRNAEAARRNASDDEQIAHLRHFVRLADQIPGDWAHMGTSGPGQEGDDALHYQLAMMSYAVGAAQFHRTPAWRELYRDIFEKLIEKMLRFDVWGYWGDRVARQLDLRPRPRRAGRGLARSGGAPERHVQRPPVQDGRALRDALPHRALQPARLALLRVQARLSRHRARNLRLRSQEPGPGDPQGIRAQRLSRLRMRAQRHLRGLQPDPAAGLSPPRPRPRHRDRPLSSPSASKRPGRSAPSSSPRPAARNCRSIFPCARRRFSRAA